MNLKKVRFSFSMYCILHSVVVNCKWGLVIIRFQKEDVQKSIMAPGENNDVPMTFQTAFWYACDRHNIYILVAPP
jgi:hypothetical protein